ncbi:MAG TPA: hypothetical protein VGN72_08530 [Tepidisphaeraceae bacterium]|jgi:glycopeptide antibiotics resistance protein|nr:hypothetical protein [Tepidisphaeraceae bacterium]
MQNGISRTVKLLQALAIMVVAVLVIWRGATHNESNYSIMPTLMCALFAIMLLFTAVTALLPTEDEPYNAK